MAPKRKTLISFDPVPSVQEALDILDKAGVQSFALIGRLALWAYVDEDQQEFTKDADFAVPYTKIADIEKEVRTRGLYFRPLRIGGIGVRETSLSIDFIDRREQVESLFREAIEKTTQTINIETGESVPLVPSEYLLAMKMVSGEPKDDRDTMTLLKQGTLDFAKAREIVNQHLGGVVANRLDVFAREAGILPPLNTYEESKTF